MNDYEPENTQSRVVDADKADDKPHAHTLSTPLPPQPL